MNDFFQFIFGGSNIIPTFILSFCFIYWLIVIIGVIDMDMIDFDLDIEAEVDVDADVSAGGGEGSVAWLNNLLHFFNLGRIPFMLWLSIIGMLAWLGTVIANYILGNESFLIGAAVFLVAFIASMVVAKPLLFPVVKIFDSLEEMDGLKSVIGQLGEVVYPNKNTLPGEVEVVHNGSRIRVFILPASQDIVLERNQKVLIIAPSEKDKKVFIVEPYQ